MEGGHWGSVLSDRLLGLGMGSLARSGGSEPEPPMIPNLISDGGVAVVKFVWSSSRERELEGESSSRVRSRHAVLVSVARDVHVPHSHTRSNSRNGADGPEFIPEDPISVASRRQNRPPREVRFALLVTHPFEQRDILESEAPFRWHGRVLFVNLEPWVVITRV